MEKYSIFILYLSTYTTAFSIRNAQESLDYEDGINSDNFIRNDIAEEIGYEKSRNTILTEDDFFDIEQEQQFGQPTTRKVQKRDLNNNNKQYLYHTDRNNQSGYNPNTNNLEWYSCSTGLVVQLRRTGLNSPTNTNSSGGYNSIYNYFVKNLNNTNNPYNIKNNTIIKGYYGTYKVVRAYRQKNNTNYNISTNNPNRITKNDKSPNNEVYNTTQENSTINPIRNENNKNDLTNNPGGQMNNTEDIVKKKLINNSCSIMSSINCPIGFKMTAGYCIPDPECYTESVDYNDYEFDFIEE